jgi:hypothetical protein
MAYVLDQSQTLYGTSLYLQMRVANPATWQATKFTPSVTANIGKVSLRLCKIGAPTGNIWVEICAYSNDATGPGATLAQSDNVDVSTLNTSTTTGALQDFIFSTGYSLAANTTYWIKYNGDYTRSNTNHSAGFIKQQGSGTFGYNTGTSWVFPYATNAQGCFLEYYVAAAANIPAAMHHRKLLQN